MEVRLLCPVLCNAAILRWTQLRRYSCWLRRWSSAFLACLALPILAGVVCGDLMMGL